VRNTWTQIVFSFLPTAVLSSVGIMILVLQRAGVDIVFGVLILILSVAVLTGGIVSVLLYARQAREARLQTDFVAKVSHELRTPLASIRMFVDTLQDPSVDDPDERAMCLDVISTETSRLTSMIERLLSWGRMEAGRRTFEAHPESTATLVGEALAQLEPQLANSPVEVETEIPEDPPAVLADRAALVEALRNLLSNALKYGGSGGVVRVRVSQDGKRALIDVEDEGPGIPRKEHRQVFERFYRGRAQVMTHTPGSGLGLAMATLVVKAHKGKIRLRSTPGEGSCFSIDLPALPDAGAALEVPPG